MSWVSDFKMPPGRTSSTSRIKVDNPGITEIYARLLSVYNFDFKGEVNPSLALLVVFFVVSDQTAFARFFCNYCQDEINGLRVSSTTPHQS